MIVSVSIDLTKSNISLQMTLSMILYNRTAGWQHCAMVISEESLLIHQVTFSSSHKSELFKAVEQAQSALK